MSGSSSATRIRSGISPPGFDRVSQAAHGPRRVGIPEEGRPGDKDICAGLPGPRSGLGSDATVYLYIDRKSVRINKLSDCFHLCQDLRHKRLAPEPPAE